jgi:hypothetical protein
LVSTKTGVFVLRQTLTTLAFLVRLNDAGETAMMKDTDRKLEPHIQELCRSAEQELGQLMRDRAQVVKRICTIKRTLAGLAKLFGESILDEELTKLLIPKTSDGQPGLTAVCRELLLKEGEALTAHEVYRLISQRLPSLLAGHKEPVSSVTTVLNRLVKYGEAESVLVGKRRAWQKAKRKRNQQ